MNMISMTLWAGAMPVSIRFGRSLAAFSPTVFGAEAADFLWESRVLEHYLGQHLDTIPGEERMAEDVSRVALLSFLDGRWRAGICLIDGEGAPVDLLWKRMFESREEAEYAFIHAR
jgi:hypothetical protein